jgi:hypothetical protein
VATCLLRSRFRSTAHIPGIDICRGSTGSSPRQATPERPPTEITNQEEFLEI